MENGKRLLAFTCRDFKRVQYCRIDFKDAITLIGGENSQGKSSVLDGLLALFSHKKDLPADPVRDGAEEAHLFADFGEFTLEKTIAIDGSKPKLVMKDAEQNPVKITETELQQLLAADLWFDPLEFARMKPEHQDLTLKTLVGLDTSDLDEKRRVAFEERTELGREVKKLEGQASALKHDPTAPEAEVSVSDLMQVLERKEVWANGNQARAINRDMHQSKVDMAKQRLDDAQAEYDKTVRALAVVLDAIEKAPEQPPGPEISTLREQIKSAGDTNKKVTANRERSVLLESINTKKARSGALTRELDRIEVEKAERLAGAKFPLPGLGFDELGVSWNGHPLSQAGQADRVEISTAVMLALNPDLPLVMIRDGSLMDAKCLERVTKLANERVPPAQVLIEVVTRNPTEDAACDVVMRDGVGSKP